MTEDSQQISVSELLKRNGQQVESRGGRRRRGVAGGISVAELTGEIPVVRDPSDSRALEPEPEQEPAAPEPSRTPAPAAPSARADERTGAFKAPADDSDEDDDEPIASRPAGRGRAVVSGGTSRDHQGTWVSRAVRKEPPAPEAAASTPAPTVAAPAVKKPEPAPTVAAPRVTPAPKTETPAKPDTTAKAEPAVKSDAPAKSEAPAKPGMPAKAGAAAKSDSAAKADAAAASNGASKFVKTPKPEAPAKAKPEPALLSGSTLAGDLMRQSRDSDAANAAEKTDLIEAATDEADTEKRDGDTQKSDTPRRSRKEAKAEAAKAEKAGKGEAGENSTREWVVLIGQGVVAVIAGALLFKGFEKLWDVFPWVALILALLVIVGLVAMVRILRRTDDITSFVIAVVVGMIVTLGPLAFMLASG
ncbi:hypothetical protein [Rhodococcus sp. NCIMB 12038]|uniref:hypothetical protein n=1 Tax=Rhodococcus sp. NCIMB 12038 TaxID=933800 RepID=UPI000B3CD20E|nr:hypothetical protein [Rhodococcus sp. NCIMB 12038]OUS89151.1 hypothetical protein CA951_37385 [Rhodococcus sp. NCIMB 12038]